MPPPPHDRKNRRRSGPKTGSAAGARVGSKSGGRTSSKPVAANPKRDADDGSKLHSRAEARREAASAAKPRVGTGSRPDAATGSKPRAGTDGRRAAGAGAKPRATSDARRDTQAGGKPDDKAVAQRGAGQGAKPRPMTDPRRGAEAERTRHAKQFAAAATKPAAPSSGTGLRHGRQAGAPADPGSGQRIAKLLARAGIASRREIERMIAEGRIALNGVPLDTPATILTTLRGVTVDGAPVQAAAPTRLFRFHKPFGLLTAERDPLGRPTIYDRLPADLPRVIPVGRLDLNTEGLLLLTTDGELKRQLELPRTGVVRSYRARAYGQVSQAQLEDLIEGVEIDGVRYGSIDANLERRTGANVWVEMKLTEGKNREVRRVLEHLGLQVSRLIRTSYGTLSLGDLPGGAVDEVPQHELAAFRKALG